VGGRGVMNPRNSPGSCRESLVFFEFAALMLRRALVRTVPRTRARARSVAHASRTPRVPAKHAVVYPPDTLFAPHDPCTTPATTHSPLSPDTWLRLQLPSSSALSAFAHRVGLAAVLCPADRVQQICIHPSFVPFYSQFNKHPVPDNYSLSVLGNALLGLFAAEHLHVAYPHLPNRVLKAAVTAFVGPATCATVARQIGAAPLLRWRRSPRSFAKPALMMDDALASIPRSILAVLYQQRSIHAARTFFNDFFMSREFDIRSLIKSRDPKLALRKTVEHFQREPCKSRYVAFMVSPAIRVGKILTRCPLDY
jgi:dsRNA-specific ribonuclease